MVQYQFPLDVHIPDGLTAAMFAAFGSMVMTMGCFLESGSSFLLMWGVLEVIRHYPLPFQGDTSWLSVEQIALQWLYFSNL